MNEKILNIISKKMIELDKEFNDVIQTRVSDDKLLKLKIITAKMKICNDILKDIID